MPTDNSLRMVAVSQGACPCCRRDDAINYSEAEVHEQYVFQEAECGQCGNTWEAAYRLVEVEVRDE